MKTKVETLEDNQIKLSVTVDAKTVDARIKKTYKDFAHTYNFPGFRRGKAPRPVIDNALGAEAVRASVTDDVLQELYPLAVDEAGIFPISQAKFEDQESLVENGKDFVFVATLKTKPELALSSYEPVEIELPKEGASELEIEDQIQIFREHYFTFEDAGDAAEIQEGGVADIAMTVSDEEGNELESLTSESRVYTLGSGMFPPEFDENLLGLKKGEKKEFDLEFKGLYTAGLASIAGQVEKAHFSIEVTEVKEKVLPELSDEWVKDTVGFEGIEDLKTKIAESISKQKAETLPGLKERASLTALSKRLEGDVPEEMIASSETDLFQTFFQQLQSQGATLDAYLQQMGIEIDDFRKDVKEQAIEITRQDLSLDAWARHKGMEVTEEDLLEEFKNSGAEDPKALEKEWRENGRLHMLRQGILRMRATEDLMETAKVSEYELRDLEDEDASKKNEAEKPSTDESAVDAESIKEDTKSVKTDTENAGMDTE